MSFQAMAWAVDQKPAGTKEKFVLLMLANYASNDQGECYPSLQEICDATLLSRDSVIRALKSLEEDGFISIEKKRQGRVNLPNVYTLNLRGVVAQSDHEGSRNVQGGSRTEPSGVVAQSDPNLSEEPIIAKPRERDFSKMLDRMLEAAGIGDFRAERSLGLLNIAPIMGLIDAGFDFEKDILPAIRSRNNGSFRPKTWAYYVDVVRDFVAARSSAGSVRKQAPAEIDWPDWCDAFFADGTWKDTLGPRPGEAGCRAPAEIVDKARRAAA